MSHGGMIVGIPDLKVERVHRRIEILKIIP